MANLLYGAGLRLMECVQMRVKDVDFDYRQLIVRDGKGQQDRVTMLPHRMVDPLQRHLEKIKLLHQQDCSEGFGEVYLPYALERKYPRAKRAWEGQYAFPARQRSVDPRSGRTRRHHTDKKFKGHRTSYREAGKGGGSSGYSSALVSNSRTISIATVKSPYTRCPRSIHACDTKADLPSCSPCHRM